MGRTIALALAAAVYPTLLAGVIVILGQPRPRPLLFGFLLGGMTMSVIAGVVVTQALRESDHTVSLSQTTRPVLSIALGLLALAFAFGAQTGRMPQLGLVERRRERRAARPKPSGPGFPQRVLSRGSVTLAVVAGALLNLPGIWYLAALTDIATVDHVSARLTQILVFNLIMFALVEVPLVMFVVDEERANARVRSMDEWIHAHRRGVTVAVALVVGVYLVVRGLVKLL